MILKFWNTLLKFWTTILKFRNTILMPKNCKFFLNVDQPKFMDLTVAICSNNEDYIFVEVCSTNTKSSRKDAPLAKERLLSHSSIADIQMLDLIGRWTSLEQSLIFTNPPIVKS
jgi:hypothetical protein